MDIFHALTMLGGLCLFLFGMNFMGQALERRAGGKLRTLLDKMTGSVGAGFLTGLGITAIIQSSSATTVMVVGFVNSGLMTLRQAINVIMGANVGTTVTAWLLSLAGIDGGSVWLQLLKPTAFTPVLALIGIIFYMFCKDSRKKETGSILLGFATLMFGMDNMSAAVAGLKDVPGFAELFLAFTNPLLGVLVGAVLTASIQSAAASVGSLQALASSGQVSYAAAVPIIMGQNIGTCVTALISCVGTNKNAKRAAVVHISFYVIGTAGCMVLFYGANAIIHFTFLDAVLSSVSIALMNTLFRLASVIVLLPCIGLMERKEELLFPDDDSAAEDRAMDRLEEPYLQHPALSIEQSRLVTNSVAERAEGNLLMAVGLRNRWSDKDLRMVGETESVIDRYEDKLGTYLMKITSKSLSQSQSEEVSKYLHTISDFERISDHALNIAEGAKELHEKYLSFSDAAAHELEVVEAALTEILSTAIRSFVNNDLQLAARVAPLEELIDNL